MNRKNIIKYMWAGLLTVLLGSTMTACDPLGIEPTTKVDEDRFWTNPQLARAYVNNLYLIGSTGSGHTCQSEQWSDNCQGNYEQYWDTYRQLTFNNRRYDETAAWSGPWSGAYKNIYNINKGIEKITGSGSLSEPLRAQLLAECYFFRAWVYFDMEKFWGTVPYVDHALSLDEDTYLPQAKREQLFDNMLADLDKSIENFTIYGGKSEIGQVNIDAAYAFKSRVALYAADAAAASAKGIFRANDPAGLFTFEKTDAHYYQLAYDAAKKVIGKYALEPNYATLFTSETAHTSVESIWPVLFKPNQREGFNPTAKNGPDGNYYENSESLTLSWSMRTGTFPTQDLVDCYLQKDAKDGQWKPWWKTSQAQELNVVRNADGEFEGKGDDYREIYKNRDQRFYSTVTYDGSYMANEKNQAPRYQIQTWIDTTTMVSERTLQYSALHTGYRSQETLETAPVNRGSCQTITGYYSRKYSHFDSYNDNGSLDMTQRTTCYFNIRYAEVLLNCAEAAIKLNKSSEAEGYINQIRQRAGVGNFNQALEEHNLWEEMKIQRRLEFAFECPGFRYFDLLRWGEAEGLSEIPELNRVSRGIQIFRVGKHSNVAGENGVALEKGEEGYMTPTFRTIPMDYSYYLRKFDNTRYYFTPFSDTTLRDYKQLQQNPGWNGFRFDN